MSALYFHFKIFEGVGAAWRGRHANDHLPGTAVTTTLSP
jgi:hypothetical protein